MCYYVFGESRVPPKRFIAVWTLLTLFDVAFIITGYLEEQKSETVCLSPLIVAALSLSYWLRVAGLVGIVLTAIHMTFEMNPERFARNLAILTRALLILPSLAWFLVGVVYLSTVSHDCRTDRAALLILSTAALFVLFLKAVLLQWSTNYSLRSPRALSRGTQFA